MSLTTFVNTLVAQENGTKKKKQQVEKEDSLNKYDSLGNKIGTWFYHEKSLRGEPGYFEFGNYQQGLRYGLWHRLDLEGRIVSMENYLRNEKNGTAYYYEKGNLVCIGNYRGGNRGLDLDTVTIINIDSEFDTTIVIQPDDKSTKHGIWRYYDARSGHLLKEEEYQVDYLIAIRYYQLPQLQSRPVEDEKEKVILPHEKNKYYTPPRGKTKSYIY